MASHKNLCEKVDAVLVESYDSKLELKAEDINLVKAYINEANYCTRLLIYLINRDCEASGKSFISVLSKHEIEISKSEAYKQRDRANIEILLKERPGDVRNNAYLDYMHKVRNDYDDFDLAKAHKHLQKKYSVKSLQNYLEENAVPYVNVDFVESRAPCTEENSDEKPINPMGFQQLNETSFWVEIFGLKQAKPKRKDIKDRLLMLDEDELELFMNRLELINGVVSRLTKSCTENNS